MASSCPSLKKWTEPSEIILPKEIWIHILSFLDFETLQVRNHSLFKFLNALKYKEICSNLVILY